MIAALALSGVSCGGSETPPATGEAASPSPAPNPALEAKVELLSQRVAKIEDRYVIVRWWEGEEPMRASCFAEYGLEAAGADPCVLKWTSRDSCESFLDDGSKSAERVQRRYESVFEAAAMKEPTVGQSHSTRPPDAKPTVIWYEPDGVRFELEALVASKQVEPSRDLPADFEHETLTLRGNDRHLLAEIARLLAELRRACAP